jgi:hypothetical protein
MTTKEQQIYKEAKMFKSCQLLKGTENIDELMRLFFTSQGIEFCSKFNTPSLDAFRNFKGLQATRGGFYIDTPVKAKNLPRAALIGNETVAELEYTETEGYTVVLMHGAKAKITASGYAVVFVTNAGGKLEVVQKDNAKIFL